MGKIIVIGSQKGGVGKTTTTLNLAYSLKELGKRVLTVDFDSQANLTTCYGVEDTGVLEYTIGHLMMAQIEALQIEKFFRSSWYQQLTSVAGEFLIRKLQDEIRQSE